MNSNAIIYQNSPDAASRVLTGQSKTLSRNCETVARGPKLALACFCMALEPRVVIPPQQWFLLRKEVVSGLQNLTVWALALCRNCC